MLKHIANFLFLSSLLISPLSNAISSKEILVTAQLRPPNSHWLPQWIHLNSTPPSKQFQTLRWICENTDNELLAGETPCNLYLIKNNIPEKILLAADKNMMDHSTFHKRGNNLIEMKTGCGSNCTLSTFYSFKYNKLSDSYDSVLNVQVNNDTIITVNKKGVILSSLFDTFKNDIVLIKSKNLSRRTAIMSDPIESTQFKNDKIYINYMDKNDNEKVDIIYEAASYYLTSSPLQTLFDYLTPNFQF